MIDMPRKLISLKDINNWQRYSASLNDKAFVKKYLATILKKWVENLSNPLSINWVQWMYKDKMEKLDKQLRALENKLGEENLTLIFRELKKEHGNTEAVIRKIESLEGELIAYEKLTSYGHKKLRKISKDGDWESDTTTISVKSILDLDLNYQLIENTLRGMIYIKENGILRKYSKIRLHGEKKLDDKFRTKIIWFLEVSLLSTLQFIDGELENTDNLEIETTKFYVEKGQPIGYLKICSHGYANKSRKTVKILLQEDRAGKRKLERQLKIKLETNHTPYSKIFSIRFETNTYWDGHELNFDYLQDSIQKHLYKFDKDKQRLKNGKDFVGWINISIHSMHESYVLGNKQKIEAFLRKIKCDRQYKVMFCLNPQMRFDLTKAIILEA
jgi:hypothetical protein